MIKSEAEPGRGKVRYQEVDIESQGQRLDNFLIRVLSGVPRSHIYQLIRSGQVRVNSGRVRAGYRVREGDRVRVPPIAQSLSKRSQIPREGVQWLSKRILYEDSKILVLDKPSGLAVHGGSRISLGCIEALRSLKPSLRQADLVHRLDRGTSGCLLVAIRRSALRRLHELLRRNAMKKSYLALVKGRWRHGEIEVDLPLVRGQLTARGRVQVNPEGKAARSCFRVVEHFGALASLMEVSIITGRTHQIRVHAAHMGHPVAGDQQYGDEHFNAVLIEKGLHRLFLHAQALEFVWPDSEEGFAISAPLPEELSVVLRALQH
jgi:23S rRNA pseudouridine955/2504/2580 synthase